MGRMTFVFQRLALLVPTAIGVTIITFFMVHLIPGDPAVTVLGEHATPQAVALLHHAVGPGQAPRRAVLAVHRPPAARQPGAEPLLHGARLGPDHRPPARHAVAAVLRRGHRHRHQRAALRARRQPQGRHPRPRRAGRAAARPGHAGLLVRPDPADLAGHQAPAVPGHRLRPGIRRPPAHDVPAQPDRGGRPVPGAHPQPAGQHAERARRRLHHHRAGQGRAHAPAAGPARAAQRDHPRGHRARHQHRLPHRRHAHRGAGVRRPRHRQPDDRRRSCSATSPSSRGSPWSSACWSCWSTCSPTWPTRPSTRE